MRRARCAKLKHTLGKPRLGEGNFGLRSLAPGCHIAGRRCLWSPLVRPGSPHPTPSELFLCLMCGLGVRNRLNQWFCWKNKNNV